MFEQWFEVLHRWHIDAEILQAKLNFNNETLEKELKLLKSSHRSGRRILEELDEIKAIDQTFIDKRFYSITVPGDGQKKILDILGLPLPPKVLIRE